MKDIVAGIIEKEEHSTKKYLLVSSVADFGEFNGCYYPPAGHMEPCEDEICCLEREVMEEVGIKVISSKKITTTPCDLPDQVTHWYVCQVDSYTIKMNKTELKDAGYFSKAEMARMRLWPATAKFFEEFIFKK